MNVGLEYLTLSRATGTLSGGEAQRIRLATQIGAGLVGVAYMLDEPSIGLPVAALHGGPVRAVRGWWGGGMGWMGGVWVWGGGVGVNSLPL